MLEVNPDRSSPPLRLPAAVRDRDHWHEHLGTPCEELQDDDFEEWECQWGAFNQRSHVHLAVVGARDILEADAYLFKAWSYPVCSGEFSQWMKQEAQVREYTPVHETLEKCWVNQYVRSVLSPCIMLPTNSCCSTTIDANMCSCKYCARVARPSTSTARWLRICNEPLYSQVQTF